MFNASLHRLIGVSLLIVGAGLMSGCSFMEPKTFNFIVDMPPGFKYKAVVNYIPAPGETCTVARKDNKATVYNDKWREGYEPSIDVELKRMINDCLLIMRSVRIEVFSVYGKERGDFGTDKAFIFLRDEKNDGYKMWNKPFDATGVTLVEGQCQSLFRTMGKPRILRKLLSCKNINAQGVLESQVPTGAYTLEQLAGMKPAFKKDGTVTAGNASGLNDGAAALVLASADAVLAGNLKPMARLVAYAHAGVEPELMGLGPIPATRLALQRAGLHIGDMDVIETNIAFAAQACAVMQELDMDPAKVNPNGSGIALGHPVGATGAIIATKALHELQRIQGRYALATLCIGGGQGIAVIFERV